MFKRDPLAEAAHFSTTIKQGAFLTVQAGDELNTMTIGWALVGFIWQRPILMVAVRDSRHTFGLMEAAADFTVSLPSGDLQAALKICGTQSGRDIDKFAACGLQTAAALKTLSPVIAAAGLHYECRTCFKAAMDPARLDPALEKLYPAKDYHTLYFGEIVECYATE